MKQKQDKYNIIPFPKARQPILDGLRQARHMSVIHIITEADVSDARRLVREYGKKTGEPQFLSLEVKVSQVSHSPSY